MTIRDYGRLKQHGILPVAGAFLDQAPTFLEAIEVIEDEAAAAQAQQENPHGT